MDKRKIAFLLIPLLWFAAIWGTLAYEEYQLSNGREVILNVIPVDPRDMFRGDYVTLSYEISTLEYFDSVTYGTPGSNVDVGDTIYIQLLSNGMMAYYYEYPNSPAIFTKTMPTAKNRIAVKGVVKDKYVDSDERVHLSVDYGIESYFVPEGTGKDIERRIRDGNVQARIIVDKYGNASVKSLE